MMAIFKVWDGARKCKKLVVASTLAELKTKGITYLLSFNIFTVRRYALHGLSHRNSVCPSVCHTRALCPHGSTYDRFIRSLSSEHFTYMATGQLSDDTTVNDLGHISRSLDCFTPNFSKTVCDTAKVTIDN